MITSVSGKTVLVTGATGMIGQRLVEVLAASGAQVRVISRNADRAGALWPDLKIDVQQGDLLEPGLEKRCAGADIVFHLASFQPGSGAVDPEAGEEHRQVTVTGTKALLKAAADVAVFVFVSSTRAEDGSDSDYAMAKREAEQLVLLAGNEHRMVAVLRLPPVYGAMNAGMVPAIIRGVDRGKFKILPDFGERRSLVHRDDVARALLLMATAAAANGKIYTLTDGEDYSLRSIYELTCKTLSKTPRSTRLPMWLLAWIATVGDVLQSVTGRPMPVTRQRLAKMQADAWFDGSLIRDELGFEPRYTLDRALPELVAEYRRGTLDT